MTTNRLDFEAPYGCRCCGVERRRHGRRWAPGIAMHAWMAPDQAMILERMKRRLEHRLNAAPPKHHAVTGWAPDHTGEEGIPFCADCGTDSCQPWTRIQTRLDRQRWGLPRHARPSHKALANAGGGWGGDNTWPF